MASMFSELTQGMTAQPDPHLNIGEGLLWGYAHTADSYPPKNGWRARRAVKSLDVLLIGQPGVAGCATAIDLEDGRIDVAIYSETPAELVARHKATGSFGDARYVQYFNAPGVGLHVIAEINADR